MSVPPTPSSRRDGPTSAHPPDEVLERFAFDSGLHPDAKTRVAVHLQGCETCRTSVRTIRDLDFELAARVGEEVALERIRRPRPGRWRRLVARLLGR